MKENNLKIEYNQKDNSVTLSEGNKKKTYSIVDLEKMYFKDFESFTKYMLDDLKNSK